MPKRKRGHVESSPTQKLETTRRDVEKKIVHGKKLLNRAMKLAKNFERRKLARKLKLSRDGNGGAEMAKLQTEYNVLKAIDLSNVVNNYLHKSLLKSKKMLESGLLPSFVKVECKTASSSEEKVLAISNVTARMCNTKPVKETMADIFSSINSVLGITLPGESLTAGKNTSGDQLEPSGIQEGALPGDLSEEEQSTAGEDCVERLAELPIWEGFSSSVEPDPNPERKEDLSRDDSLGEGFSSGESVRQPSRARSSQRSSKVNISPSLSCSEESGSPSPVRRKSKPVHDAPNPHVSASTFLPTLMGGYWSGSEDDTGDIDDYDDAPGVPKPRKNRRGQQARRAIWEKKFGAQANHIKVQAATEKPGERNRDRNRDQGRRRDNATAGRRGAHIRSRGGSSGRARASTSREGEVTERPKTSGEGIHDAPPRPLHPSWEAARRAKAAKATTAFQGTKIIFE